MISPEQSRRLARALADEIATTIEDGTTHLLHELTRRPWNLDLPEWPVPLGHEAGWLELVWRALEVAELADEELR